MKKPQVGDKCRLYDCGPTVYTITETRRGWMGGVQYYLDSGSIGQWYKAEHFYLLPEVENAEKGIKQSWPTGLTMDDVEPKATKGVFGIMGVTEGKKPLAWIRINNTRLDCNWICEQEGAVKNLIYYMYSNTIDYDLIQDDGTEKHMTVVLPDCAEVTIGRFIDN